MLHILFPNYVFHTFIVLYQPLSRIEFIFHNLIEFRHFTRHRLPSIKLSSQEFLNGISSVKMYFERYQKYAVPCVQIGLYLLRFLCHFFFVIKGQ